ncbi:MULTISPECIES: precorrin-3B C(17)-methyltransferase [Methanothermobacter]|jgi:precorrin-3B C17-methyltransferase|uniref:Probable cobalt-factor III C(17)-methyltransferase n=1 Tax=Methanothermobacter thermautotrophicus (strain ATCC 29096 / DSM 1053 / JCM 10044 / NBRC 100330 / Delta H) TaxID=187420 RepID=CBIH_METTH|nr:MULTISPECIES: precorrin-3B C(17)-methyltransferase [Methanothermobacter]O27454.1 RecName: Full=Probable cobalt-factor III C(17)-methyltransferase; AltName: Full=Cobalt-precorrin-3 methyltransferase; Short=Cobalt-precorrin-3 methylase [Methanothermobacter thermautotrophicus str. Delta H]AAB85880.1 precorrin-3 methylase [Methanothermobacter thermautotrophicus str. Delta H]WBF05922.1 precorrin-3B C(17)-methyltransferase [Methanothermobacter thermautotrophicus]BAZ99405.1 putative cobalt-factor I
MIRIIGIGPARDDITIRALRALEDSDVVIGYARYIRQIEDLLDGKEVIRSGMGDEIERVELAIEKHREGLDVALVSSGDPGVYGMANVFFQIFDKYSGIEFEVIPGVTAVNYAASKLGAPLHDFAVISLSDILTPLSEIMAKIRAAAESGMIIALYNPLGKRRKRPFREAVEILRSLLPPQTPVGIVRTVDGAPDVRIVDLESLDESLVDMSTIVLVGNVTTYTRDGQMITPRGYAVETPLHELAREFYEENPLGKASGPDENCEFYPCHFEGQNCAFCYCPFYPCAEGSTGGRWIRDRGVWSCQDCTWIHTDSAVECVKRSLGDIISGPDDLMDKKRELLKLRRECLMRG